MKSKMRLSWFFLIIVLFVNCNNLSEKKNVLKNINRNSNSNSNNYSLQYDIFYSSEKIKLCLIDLHKNKKEFNCETLIKRKGEYYSENGYPKGLSNSPDYNLILSNCKDTSYYYRSAGNINSYEIKKINNSVFKSTIKITGMSNFKRDIFFDKNYNILRIESYYGNEKYIFK